MSAFWDGRSLGPSTWSGVCRVQVRAVKFQRRGEAQPWSQSLCVSWVIGGAVLMTWKSAHTNSQRLCPSSLRKKPKADGGNKVRFGPLSCWAAGRHTCPSLCLNHPSPAHPRPQTQQASPVLHLPNAAPPPKPPCPSLLPGPEHLPAPPIILHRRETPSSSPGPRKLSLHYPEIPCLHCSSPLPTGIPRGQGSTWSSRVMLCSQP